MSGVFEADLRISVPRIQHVMDFAQGRLAQGRVEEPDVGRACHDDGVGVRDLTFLKLAGQLPGVSLHETANYSSFKVDGRTFGYLWPRTQTVGLKQPLAEQLALVAERPNVFEVQFTAGAFGWVVIQLAGIDRRELSELTFEAWRLTASAELVEQRGDRLPR